MGERRKSRECALQVLYSIDISNAPVEQSLNLFWREHAEASSEVVVFAEAIVGGTISKLEEIDSVISSNSANWKISRMAAVDRNILRMAIYELLYLKDIPKRVTINEAIEIAKIFGTEESKSFINGILDKISKGITDKE